MLADWTRTVQDGLSAALSDVIGFIPEVVGALIVLLVGVIVGVVLKNVVVQVLKALNLKSVTERVGWQRVFPGKYDFVDLLGDLVKWFFIVVFLLQALAIVNILEVDELVRDLLGFVPRVVATAALVLVGGIIADLTSRVVVSASRAVGSRVASFLGGVARWAIWVVVVFTGLAQLGVNTVFLERLFTAVVVMLALAGGLAFGLGGRDMAKDVLDDIRKGVVKRD